MNELLSFAIMTANAAFEGEGTSVVGFLLTTILPCVAFFAIMYFIMVRPQKKKQKEEDEMRKNLQIGDEVTTIGGIVGIIVRKGEDTVVIETGGDRSKIRIKTAAIQSNATIHDAKEE